MGTLIERRRKDGAVAFLAQISLTREGKIAHRESKTFERRQSAAAWLKKREAELEKPGELLGAKSRITGATLADAIDRYLAQSSRAMGKTKLQVLRKIKSFDLADKRCAEITSQDYLEFAQALASEGCKPQMVENYLSHLGAVVTVARPAWVFALAVAFAIFSTRRLDEITRIVWTELDEADSRVMVREMKNPGGQRRPR